MITRRDMTAYTIGLLLGSLLTFFTFKANAYEMAIYQSESSEYDSVVEIINDCGQTHRLVLQTKNVKPSNNKMYEWIFMVLDKCD